MTNATLPQEIRELIYKACLKAAQDMGPDIKAMSWFGRNFTALKSPDKIAA